MRLSFRFFALVFRLFFSVEVSFRGSFILNNLVHIRKAMSWLSLFECARICSTLFYVCTHSVG